MWWRWCCSFIFSGDYLYFKEIPNLRAVSFPCWRLGWWSGWGAHKCLWILKAIPATRWVRVWPSFWILVPGFCSSRSLDLVAIGMKIVAVNWNYGWVHTIGHKGLCEKTKDTYGNTVTMSFPWWFRNLFIHHQQIPSQVWGYFLPGRKVLTSLLEPPEWWFKGQSQPATAPHCQTRPLRSYHFFLAHPGTSENVTLLRDAGWIGGLSKDAIYPTCTNQHQKIVVLATLKQGPSGSRVVSWPVTCKQ